MESNKEGDVALICQSAEKEKGHEHDSSTKSDGTDQSEGAAPNVSDPEASEPSTTRRKSLPILPLQERPPLESSNSNETATIIRDSDSERSNQTPKNGVHQKDETTAQKETDKQPSKKSANGSTRPSEATTKMINQADDEGDIPRADHHGSESDGVADSSNSKLAPQHPISTDDDTSIRSSETKDGIVEINNTDVGSDSQESLLAERNQQKNKKQHDVGESVARGQESKNDFSGNESSLVDESNDVDQHKAALKVGGVANPKRGSHKGTHKQAEPDSLPTVFPNTSWSGMSPIDVGCRVYAEFPDNKEWYWGQVTKRSKKRGTRYPTFSILFDDGDMVDGIPSSRVVSKDLFHEYYEPVQRPVPQDKKRRKGKKGSKLTRRTKSKKLSKGTTVRRSNRAPKVKDQGTKVICIDFDEQAHGGDENESSRESVGGQQDSDFEFQETEQDSDEFDLDESPTPEEDPLELERNTSDKLSSEHHNDCLDPAKLYQQRCETCSQCIKADCGFCASCLRSETLPKHVCFQKMCTKIPEDHKAQPAKGFPRGWRFVSTDENPTNEHSEPSTESAMKKLIESITIISPCSQRFKNVTAARNHFSSLLGDENNLALEFYSHVGVLGQLHAGNGLFRAGEMLEGSRLSLQQLLLCRCTECENCKKNDCGLCDSCKANGRGNQDEKGICFKRMCHLIPPESKAQASHLLPRGWVFWFGTDALKKHPQHEGLVIRTSGGRQFRSVGAIKNSMDKSQKAALSIFLGMQGPGGTPRGDESLVSKDTEDEKRRRSFPESKASREPKRLESRRSDPPRSVAEATGASPGRLSVGERVYCRWENGSYYWGVITKKFRTSHEFRYSVTFDDGDFLSEVRDHPAGEQEQTIYTQEEYSRIRGGSTPDFAPLQENAVEHGAGPQPKEPTVAAQPEEPTAGQQLEEPRAAPELEEPNAKRRKTSEEAQDLPQGPFSLEQLLKNRCGVCCHCEAPDCGRCSVCVEYRKDPTQIRTKVCIRKICVSIPIEKRARDAPGFPRGWRFDFVPPKSNKPNVSSLAGLRLLSPDGRVYRSLKAALAVCEMAGVGRTDEISLTLFRHIGERILRQDPNHFLMGKQFYTEWMDLYRRKKALYGIVVGCEYDEHEPDKKSFRVEYDRTTRSTLNAIPNDWGSSVPTYQKMSLPWAKGGCVMFSEKMKILQGLSPDLPDYWTWTTADLMRTDQVADRRGDILPCLTLFAKGFRLVFSVKRSLIHGAGRGVFVKCFPLYRQQATPHGASDEEFIPKFSLRNGELLDLGVYAPFRFEDKKKDVVFYLKNYIHGFKCEEWAFDTFEEDSQFDITDDLTGELHDRASESVLSFVNECHQDDIPTVQAEHDPDGNVHYLLGHRGHPQKAPLIIEADGSEKEIYINYGDGYEYVRNRKGYSFLPGDNRAWETQNYDATEAECLLEILEYNEQDLEDCVRFFYNIFVDTTRFLHLDPKVVQRGLGVMVLMRFRIQGFQQRGERVYLTRWFEMNEKTIATLVKESKDSQLKRMLDAKDTIAFAKKVLTPLFVARPGRELWDLLEMMKSVELVYAATDETSS